MNRICTYLRRTVVYGVLLTTLAALPGPLAAQDIEAKGRKVVERAIEALGGDAFFAIQNRVEHGRAYSFRFGELRGLAQVTFYTRYLDVDPSETGSRLAIQQYQGIGEKEDYYNILREEGAWEVTYRGPAPMEGDALARFKDNTLHDILYILRVRRNEPGMIFESRGTQVVDNVPVDVVDVIDSENRVVTVYFTQSSGLPMRADWSWRDPVTRRRNDEVVRWSLYREVDGAMWPHQTSREQNDAKAFEMFSETVEFNQEFDEARLAIPDEDSRPFKR